MKEKINKQPNKITTCYIEAIIMPNGEVICLGKTIGFFNELKGVIYNS